MVFLGLESAYTNDLDHVGDSEKFSGRSTMFAREAQFSQEMEF